jgi:phage terminase small subunit
MTKITKLGTPARKAIKGIVETQAKGSAPDVAGQLPVAESAEQARFRRAQEIVNGFNLAPRIKLFVMEYTKDMSGTQAAIRAGYLAKTANEQAAQHLAKLSIKQAIDAVMNDRIEQGIFDGDMVISRWVEISQANPNSLTQYRWVNCRYCWGEGHRYQFTPAEIDQASKIPYCFDEKARYHIEPKDKMKEEGILSPDPWDTVCMAFLESVHYIVSADYDSRYCGLDAARRTAEDAFAGA